ncbi:MAG: alpha/beta fold hydrolase [Burkholderiaceae bacterium]
MYQALRPSHSAFVPVRNLRYHVLRWGAQTPAPPVQPQLLMVHGWMDVGASFQFMVDALPEPFLQNRLLLAPDWRGFGLTDSGGADNFWFADYLADLDALIDHCSPDQPVDLLGHSMGGNVAMLYAGVRPGRIRKLVNLEGFGLPATQPSQGAGRYAKWMDELKALHRGDTALKRYPDAASVAQRLMKTNPRLGADKAAWLAQHWARENAAGQWEILGEAAHKITSAHLYQLDQVLDIYTRITAPVLAVEADGDSLGQFWGGKYTMTEYRERLKQVPQVQTAVIQDAGHMLHHDQPQVLAELVQAFLK